MAAHYVTRPRLSLMFFFSGNQRRVHSWASYLCRCNYATLDFVKFIVKTSEQTNNFFQWQECFLDFLFFSRNYAWNLGVRLIHKCGLYTSLYGIWASEAMDWKLDIPWLSMIALSVIPTMCIFNEPDWDVCCLKKCSVWKNLFGTGWVIDHGLPRFKPHTNFWVSVPCTNFPAFRIAIACRFSSLQTFCEVYAIYKACILLLWEKCFWFLALVAGWFQFITILWQYTISQLCCGVAA